MTIEKVVIAILLMLNIFFGYNYFVPVLNKEGVKKEFAFYYERDYGKKRELSPREIQDIFHSMGLTSTCYAERQYCEAFVRRVARFWNYGIRIRVRYEKKIEIEAYYVGTFL